MSSDEQGNVNQNIKHLLVGVNNLVHLFFTYVKSRQDIATLNTEVNRDVLNNQVAQRQLFFYYQNLQRQKLPLPRFEDTGFRNYSQSDEDGLLLYIFSHIGFTNKICVDMAFNSPYGANTTNLILNWGFMGLLVEGKDIEESKRFFESHRDTWVFPPKVIKAWITDKNVNDLCKDNGITGEIDLFSLDMDSVDFWVWKALSVIQPRVVVVEIQPVWGANRSVTVPNKEKPREIHPDYYGASLPAFIKLGREKGYRFVGMNQYGYNAFFIKKGIGGDVLPEISPADCFKHLRSRHYMEERLVNVAHLEWLEV